MIKDWKLAVGFAVALWVLIFVIISALMVIPMPALLLTILGLLVAPIVAFFLAKIYFKKNPGEIKEGVILGVFWLIVGTILDLLVTIQYVKETGTYVDGLKEFYGAWSLWVSFVLTIIVVALVANMTRGGEMIEKPSVSPSATPPQQPGMKM
ncbi:MAG: hypothetical protein A2731_02385 [Candidatus Buchananbacteria bacterium RIFCSPHIGHO2_01_FULL_39_8]|uniref:Uncharacterized protein n=1 Tax=Candidatus Buchananbacteria bacterium RIFCSPHIGHO2_01_FULL_39_8 TaxID=1797533 RepID=A0A1G1Y1B9_9BACT|nr:MAG: hypothetical protein A2731_02385 [Candidatus Buchananbacteria bacterium RIFCSPHIGHO2_01_FULL_39_8]